MSSTVTNLPLHEVVLKIMFYEDIEKAAEMTAEDVLWRIDNPEISERQIREVLDWLVHQKKVVRYLGKYSIDRVEFIAQKELYKTSLKRDNTTLKIAKKTSSKRQTFYMHSNKVYHAPYYSYIIILGILILGYLTYTFSYVDYQFKPSTTLITQQKRSIQNLSRQKQLYVSKDDTYTEKEKSAISYSFSRQNKINKITVKTLNKLQFMIDSISQVHIKEMRFLQNEVQHSTNRYNKLLKKMIYCNIVIIVLFVIVKISSDR